MDPKFWNERFGGEGWTYGTEPNDFLRDEVAKIPKGRVLCLAEGEGRNAVFLAEHGYQVTAMDYSSEGLKKAAQLAKERGVAVDLVQGDLEEWVADEAAYTGIVSIWAHVPRAIRQRVHGWVARSLVPGGVFVLEAYTPAQIAHGTGGPKNPDLLPTLADLRAELVGLEIVVGREVEREVHEGPLHGGTSATVQVVAKKP